MRRVFLLFVLTAVAAAQAQAPRRGRKTADPAEPQGPSAASLLHLAHDQAQELPAADRASLLSRAIDMAQRIEPSLVGPWTEELFGLMPDVPEARRTALETGPVIAVSNTDLDHAMDLLERMDGASPDQLNAGADPRTMPATNVFSRYYMKNGPASLDRMRAVAAHLGSNGVYPYGAFFPALNGQGFRPAPRGRKGGDPAERDTSASEAVFSDLVQQFRASPVSYAEVSEFMRLLQISRANVPDAAYREGLSLTLNAVDRMPASTSSLTMRVGTVNNMATVDSAASILLVRLVPMVRTVDPRWAQQILDQHADVAKVDQLRAAGNNQQALRTSVTQGPSAPNAGSPEYQLGYIRGLAGSGSSDRAAQMAAGISDPGQRALAHTEIAAGVSQQNPQQAAAYLNQAKQALDSISDPAQKLKLLVALARAAYSSGDIASAVTYTTQGFTIGEDLVRDDYDANPDKNPMSLKGVSDLGALVNTAMRVDATDTVSRIGNIRYPILRAHLTLTAADAAAQRNPRNLTANYTDSVLEGAVANGGVVVTGNTAPAQPRPSAGAPNPPAQPQPPEH